MQLKPNVDTIRKSHHLAPEVVSRPWGRQDVLPAMRHSSDLMHGPRPRLLSYGERILQQYAAQTKRGCAQKIAPSHRSTTGMRRHAGAPSASLSLQSMHKVSMVPLSTALHLERAGSNCRAVSQPPVITVPPHYVTVSDNITPAKGGQSE